MLKIRQEVIDEIVVHSRQAAPFEACGYLAGKKGVVCQHFAMTNTDHSPVHYSMDPAEQFAVIKKCRVQGLKMRAVYHSHPATSAYPSAEDVRLAYDPDLSYVIVSLADTKPKVASFLISKGKVQSEPMDIVD